MAGKTSKGSTIKTTVIKDKVECSCCGRELSITNFYKSYSRINKAQGILHICKDCVWDLCNEFIEESEDIQMSIYRVCRLLDIPYLDTPFNSALMESKSNGLEAFKKYMKNINSLKQYASYTFENGDSIDKKENIEQEVIQIEESLSDRDKQNENDVIRILGYDPFETENKRDRKFLFNRLVDMLDDSVLEDNVKLMSVISMVKGFNQIEYIDQAIANLTKDIDKLNSNNGGIKSLIDTKQNLTKTVLKLAEDNGISTKFNTNKSKGSGTLTGMVKQLGELNLTEGEVNLFDIQTAQGMSQVADMSNSSIVKQLQFDENDYSEMVAWQKEELYKLQQREGKLTEDNRLLKIEIQKLKKKFTESGDK